MRFMLFFFFFNDTATTEIYTLSLHDALPICVPTKRQSPFQLVWRPSAHNEPRYVKTTPSDISKTQAAAAHPLNQEPLGLRSEEHTSELQSRQYLVCRLLLEKKKKNLSRTMTV